MHSKTFLYNGKMEPKGASDLGELLKSEFSTVESITCMLYTSPVVVICHSNVELTENDVELIQGVINDFIN